MSTFSDNPRPVRGPAAGPNRRLRLWIRCRVAATRFATVARYTIARFLRDHCFEVAASLAYTALLAVVPLMTIGFAIFSAFPAFGALRNRAEQLLITTLVPTVGDIVLENLSRFMSNAGRMTAFGVVGLAISSVLLLGTIESSFRAIWRVTEPRPLLMRFLAFWALLTLTPILFGASLSFTGKLYALAHVTVVERLTDQLVGMALLLPWLLEFVGITVLYLVIPNRGIRLGDAMSGALVSALGLELSKAGFALYLTTFPAYQTIYGALSAIPIFLLWLYIAWSTLLVGAELTAALPELRSGHGLPHDIGRLAPGHRLTVALAILHRLLMASRHGTGLRRSALEAAVCVNFRVLDVVLDELRERDWVERTARDCWILTRDLNIATLHDLYTSLGLAVSGSPQSPGGPVVSARLQAILDAADSALSDILTVPLRTLLIDPAPDRDSPERPAIAPMA
ncbi:MAG: YihY family inner membrane protein [Azospirillaceae bacterium]|nr:YihY family inner membrane protein [Azospirillaceae bacterium]